jgi:hypothetical protein
MADKKISELDFVTLPLAGTELVPIVQGGVTKKVASSNLGGGGGGDLSSLVRQEYTYTSGGQTFTLSNTPSAIYSVFVNGQELNSSQYSIATNVLTIIDTLTSGDSVNVVFSGQPVGVNPSYTKIETDDLLDAKEDTIPLGTTSQYYRGDKTFQNVADLPISTATQTALDLKQNVIINDTGGVTGDLLERNSDGIYIPKKKVEIGKNKSLFEKSPFVGNFSKKNLYAWDTFQRANSGSLGTSDSGNSWVNLRNGYSIVSETANALVTDVLGNFSGILLPTNNNRCKVTSVLQSTPPVNANRAGIWIGQNEDNCVTVSVDRNIILIEKRIEGVITIIQNLNIIGLLNVPNTGVLGSTAFLNQPILVNAYLYTFSSFSREEVYFIATFPGISPNIYANQLNVNYAAFNNSINYAGVFSYSSGAKNLGIQIEIPNVI